MDNHHAVVLFGSSIAESSVPLEYKTQRPDVVHVLADRFSIAEARELIRSAELLAFEGGSRIFVLCAQEIALDAQNALLKLFEEPPAHVRFFIVLKQSSYILPTLLSRLFVYDEVKTASLEDNETFQTFMSASYKDRLTLVADNTKNKNATWIEALVQGCEDFAASSPHTHQNVLKKVLFVRSYIGTKGSSAKMLLEELALSLPLK